MNGGSIEKCNRAEGTGSNVRIIAPEAQCLLAPRFSVGKRIPISSLRSPIGTALNLPNLLFPFQFSILYPLYPRLERASGILVSVMQIQLCPFGVIKCRLGASMAACALLALAQLLTSAQETTLHVDVKLVNLFVNVTDRNGAIASGLTREDFALAEDGRPQQIAVFERQSELPLNLTLAIDTSGSVQKDMSAEADAARRFAHAILRPHDRMNLLEFATEVRELTPFTARLSQIDRGLGRLRGDWSTALYDAIVAASERLGKNPERSPRRVLVLVSDGDDTASRATYSQALEAALRNEVMIYTIIDVPIEASAGRDLGGEHALITLAEETGGKSFYTGDGGLAQAFAQVSGDLRTQYLLAYYPKDQKRGSAFHRVQVTIPRAAAGEFNIRHKSGYYLDPAKGN